MEDNFVDRGGVVSAVKDAIFDCEKMEILFEPQIWERRGKTPTLFDKRLDV